MSISESDPIDVAIVGAGVAGLYCAWRLRCDGPEGGRPPAVMLFEADGRVGGRVASFAPPRMAHVVGELGAMQFLSTQPLVGALATGKLGLSAAAMPLTKPADQLIPDSISYLRGRHMRGSEVSAAAGVPYNLAWAERGRDPAGLLRDSLELLLPGVTGLRGAALEAFMRRASVEGEPLFRWGFWNLLGRVLSAEACRFIRDSLGYGFFLSNYNAVAMIREVQVIFPPITYFSLVDGYDQLPLTLAAQFEGRGGTLRRGWRLLSFEPAALDDGEGYLLTFEVGAPAGGAPATVRLRARTLVLALPRRAIELLGRRWPDPPPGQAPRPLPAERLIGLVTPVPIVKIFLCYPAPWWRRVTTDLGVAFSDLPVQQCIYWGVEGEQPGGQQGNTSALTMAAFADTLNAGFWEGLLGAPSPPADAGDPGSANWQAHAIDPSSRIARETHRQLLEIHGLPDAPQPYAAAVADWGADPYGGAVHYWQHHVNPWEAAGQLLQPVPGRRLFICGEAYSSAQGWVEGALQTAEQLLQHPDFPFRLAPPAWLVAQAKQVGA